VKFVKGDIVHYQGMDCEILGYDYMTGEYSVKTKGVSSRWVEGNMIEKYGTLVKGGPLEDFAAMSEGWKPPPLPKDEGLWCKCANADKELVKVVVLKTPHAICRTCKKEDKSYYGEQFLKGELK
jgi:hypothetical protein